MGTPENIKRIRKEKGLTQKELGNLCGMADSAIRRYESGRANPKIETLQRIAIALDVPITSLAEYETPLDYAFAELHAYQATEDQKYNIFLELLRSMGYIVEFNGCYQIRDLHVYDEELKGFQVNNKIITSCSLNKNGCIKCPKRENTYFRLSKNGNSVNIKFSTMNALLSMATLQIDNLLTTIFENGDV